MPLLLHPSPPALQPSSPALSPLPQHRRYANAEDVFRKIDRLIRAVHEEGKVVARYSTPQEYVEAKRKERTSLWPLKNATDFFPYADSPHKVWSGYFTSRPALKGYIRTSSATFSVARMLHALASAASGASVKRAPASLRKLEEALAVASHHDAITGTSRQDVAFDYAQSLAIGVAQADGVISASLNTLLGEYREWRRCARLNETVCEFTQNSTKEGSSVRIAVVNSLAQSRQEVVTVPVESEDVTITSAAGVLVPIQVYAADESVTNYARNTQEATLVASFVAHLPPLGIATYQMAVPDRRRRRSSAAALVTAPAENTQPMFPEDAEVLYPPQTYVQPSTAGHQQDLPANQSDAQRGNVTLSNEYLELNFSKSTGAPIVRAARIGCSRVNSAALLFGH